MDYKLHSFRLAEEILKQRTEWFEFQNVIDDLTPEKIVSIHNSICARGGRIPAGGQISVNRYFDTALSKLGWESQPLLFGNSDEKLERWKMDFIKNKIGVEITFNHAEAIPWIFSRLNIAGESERVQKASRVEVGIAVFASQSFKTWAKMDGAVGTFELATAWLREMKPILPIPLMVIGLSADGWPSTSAFRGTSKGNRSKIGR